mmetsp:Transcript_106647/g.183910  ORF Transcript_106647/g.183910 Transcript_106647/m.183910 type:complete len:228 (-) Transcript_106647:85-768(-)
MAPFYLYKAALLFGLTGIKIKVIKGRTAQVRPMLSAFFSAMEKYHRSTPEIAAQRGLVPQGYIDGVRSYVDEVRAYKGMYTQSPPITDRNTAADRWKWDIHRSHVMPYPNTELMQEILYSTVKLGMDSAPEGTVTVPAESLEHKGHQKEVEESRSGAKVTTFWEDNRERFRTLVSDQLRDVQRSKKARRQREVTKTLKENPGLTSPEVDGRVRAALKRAVWQQGPGP